MPWIKHRKPECKILEDTGRIGMASKVTAELRRNPALEVHVTCTPVGYAATLIDRGSVNYRPEEGE